MVLKVVWIVEDVENPIAHVRRLQGLISLSGFRLEMHVKGSAKS
jgi:hypothetical protein